jgi:serine/threonine protein kinase
VTWPERPPRPRDEKGELLLKILDFGLAKTTLIDAARPESLTVPGTVLGTMGYMSPEQIEGKAVDPRSDIFSVGILLAEALTGRPPFRGTTLRELLYSTMTHEFRLPGEEPGILALNTVLTRCLAKERDERYASVEALRRELLPALDACPRSRDPTASDVDVPTTRLSDDPLRRSRVPARERTLSEEATHEPKRYLVTVDSAGVPISVQLVGAAGGCPSPALVLFATPAAR